MKISGLHDEYIAGTKSVIENPIKYGLCQWVKASERLPIKSIDSVAVKYNGIHFNAIFCRAISNPMFMVDMYNIFESDFHKIEWLEEPM